MRPSWKPTTEMPSVLTVAVASGKGGTGKTTVAVNLALALSGSRSVQFLDCDVEAPNAHLFLKPRFEASEDVVTPVPEVDESLCDRCGVCARVCAYNALAVAKDVVLVFPELCHGCGACSLLCPREAIREVPRKIGTIDSGRAGPIEFARGRLDVGQALSPPVIRSLKRRRDPSRTVVVDAPPGTSCPVIESMREADGVLLVTEPTPFGLHDLELAAAAAKALGLPRGVVINRAGAGEGEAQVRAFCSREGLPVLMSIPFERRIAEAYSRAETLIDIDPVWKERFVSLFAALEEAAP